MPTHDWLLDSLPGRASVAKQHAGRGACDRMASGGLPRGAKSAEGRADLSGEEQPPPASWPWPRTWPRVGWLREEESAAYCEHATPSAASISWKWRRACSYASVVV